MVGIFFWLNWWRLQGKVLDGEEEVETPYWRFIYYAWTALLSLQESIKHILRSPNIPVPPKFRSESPPIHLHCHRGYTVRVWHSSSIFVWIFIIYLFLVDWFFRYNYNYLSIIIGQRSFTDQINDCFILVAVRKSCRQLIARFTVVLLKSFVVSRWIWLIDCWRVNPKQGSSPGAARLLYRSGFTNISLLCE